MGKADFTQDDCGRNAQEEGHGYRLLCCSPRLSNDRLWQPPECFRCPIIESTHHSRTVPDVRQGNETARPHWGNASCSSPFRSPVPVVTTRTVIGAMLRFTPPTGNSRHCHLPSRSTGLMIGSSVLATLFRVRLPWLTLALVFFHLASCQVFLNFFTLATTSPYAKLRMSVIGAVQATYNQIQLLTVRVPLVIWKNDMLKNVAIKVAGRKNMVTKAMRRINMLSLRESLAICMVRPVLCCEINAVVICHCASQRRTSDISCACCEPCCTARCCSCGESWPSNRRLATAFSSWLDCPRVWWKVPSVDNSVSRNVKISRMSSEARQAP